MARVSTAAMQMFPRRQDNANANGDNQAQQEQNNHYDQDVVDLLDVIGESGFQTVLAAGHDCSRSYHQIPRSRPSQP